MLMCPLDLCLPLVAWLKQTPMNTGTSLMGVRKVSDNASQLIPYLSCTVNLQHYCPTYMNRYVFIFIKHLYSVKRNSSRKPLKTLNGFNE